MENLIGNFMGVAPGFAGRLPWHSPRKAPGQSSPADARTRVVYFASACSAGAQPRARQSIENFLIAFPSVPYSSAAIETEDRMGLVVVRGGDRLLEALYIGRRKMKCRPESVFGRKRNGLLNGNRAAAAFRAYQQPPNFDAPPGQCPDAVVNPVADRFHQCSGNDQR